MGLECLPTVYMPVQGRPPDGSDLRLPEADDLTAETFVLARLTDEPVELWSRSRKVACFEGRKAC